YLLPLPEPDNEVVVLEPLQRFGLKIWQAQQGWVEPPDSQSRGAGQAVSADQGGAGTMPGSNRAGGVANRSGNAGSNTQASRPATIRGLELSLYKQGTEQNKPYRKVVVLP